MIACRHEPRWRAAQAPAKALRLSDARVPNCNEVAAGELAEAVVFRPCWDVARAPLRSNTMVSDPSYERVEGSTFPGSAWECSPGRFAVLRPPRRPPDPAEPVNESRPLNLMVEISEEIRFLRSFRSGRMPVAAAAQWEQCVRSIKMEATRVFALHRNAHRVGRIQR